MEERARREVRRYAVMRALTCAVTGAILDMRTAVLVQSARDGRTLVVLSPEGWREGREALTRAHETGRLKVRVDNAPADAPFQPRS